MIIGPPPKFHGTRDILLRPNLLLSGVNHNAANTWPGHALAVGDSLIGVDSPRQGCIVTSIDPDTGRQDLEISDASAATSPTSWLSIAG